MGELLSSPRAREDAPIFPTMTTDDKQDEPATGMTFQERAELNRRNEPTSPDPED
jgi:hypothetical protein